VTGGTLCLRLSTAVWCDSHLACGPPVTAALTRWRSTAPGWPWFRRTPVVQLRRDTEGRRYYRRKLAAGKTPMEAMRALKRRLSDVVYRRMLADAKAIRTGPGGHAGATMQSSAADSIPMVDTSEKSLPGPAEDHPRTPLPTAS
jgi:hypothetical protein